MAPEGSQLGAGRSPAVATVPAAPWGPLLQGRERLLRRRYKYRWDAISILCLLGWKLARVAS